ncbi:ABC transporter permease [Staphylococcus hyicus]|uniref:phenol-soluble modulin export ABC transporter permease subunit PmtD n=1 Tax=Staphylococcus hyicus TaxID=1284 RepID=UPI00217EC5CD|nr:ABC transporter permease [Staphylococcus hyicus]UWF57576.1 ABC transporter permease [Staphylococcus hyicus]
MNIMQLIKYDIISIFKSPLTYIALVLGIAPVLIAVGINVGNHKDVNPVIMFSVGKWFFSLIGLMFVVKTITRDTSQGTIQLFINNVRNRVSYFFAKFISILFISLLMTGVIALMTYIIAWTTKGPSFEAKYIWELIVFYLMLFIIYGLVLFLINLFVQKPALVYTLGILFLLILPVIKPFIPLIPEIGDNINDALKYIPFSYLSEMSMKTDLDFTKWQWFINALTIIVLFIVNIMIIRKRDI